MKPLKEDQLLVCKYEHDLTWCISADNQLQRNIRCFKLWLKTKTNKDDVWQISELLKHLSMFH